MLRVITSLKYKIFWFKGFVKINSALRNVFKNIDKKTNTQYIILNSHQTFEALVCLGDGKVVAMKSVDTLQHIQLIIHTQLFSNGENTHLSLHQPPNNKQRTKHPHIHRLWWWRDLSRRG